MNRIPLYFDFKEFLIDPTAEITPTIAQNIVQHIDFLNPIRNESGEALVVSKNSGYRPEEYEKQKGRSGNSEHTTFTIPDRGAVDLVYKFDQFKMIYDAPFFTRICHYVNNGFYHCDRKPVKGRNQYFESKSLKGPWEFIVHR